MNFNNLKEICKEHDELLEKIKIIEENTKKRHWMKVATPSSGEFYLSKEEIKLLNDYYEEKGLELENIINNLLNGEEEAERNELYTKNSKM